MRKFYYEWDEKYGSFWVMEQLGTDKVTRFELYYKDDADELVSLLHHLQEREPDDNV